MNRVSLVDIITLATIVIGGVSGWATLRSQMETNKETLMRMEEKVQRLEDSLRTYREEQVKASALLYEHLMGIEREKNGADSERSNR